VQPLPGEQLGLPRSLPGCADRGNVLKSPYNLIQGGASGCTGLTASSERWLRPPGHHLRAPWGTHVSPSLSVRRDGGCKETVMVLGGEVEVRLFRGLCGEQRPGTAHAMCAGRCQAPVRHKQMPRPPEFTFLLLFPLRCRDPRPGGVWPASQGAAGPPGPAAAPGSAPAAACPPLLPPLPGHPQEPTLAPTPRRALRGAASPSCCSQVR